jgi:hypothetical protein
MAIEAHSECDLGALMDVATDPVDAEASFVLIIHLGELSGHGMMRMNFYEA